MTVVRGLSYARIHNGIVMAISDGTFYAIAWDKDTGLITVDETVANEVAPASILVNEVRAAFDDFIRNRRSGGMERTGWRFEAHVKFEGPTSVEKFEQSVTHELLRLPANPASNLPQVDFRFVETRYDHQHHESERGTGVTFVIDVALTPV